MIDKLNNFLAAKVTLAELYLLGIALAALIILPDTIYSPPPVKMYPMSFLTAHERLLFKSEKERIEWCRRNNDCGILAEAIAYEARSESEAGKVSVAHTILNRVTDRRWGDDIKSVVYEPAQFSYTGTQIQRTKPTDKDWKSARLLAFEVLHGMIGSPVKDATHYHTIDVSPGWAKKLEYVATIDRHKFYR